MVPGHLDPKHILGPGHLGRNLFFYSDDSAPRYCTVLISTSISGSLGFRETPENWSMTSKTECQEVSDFILTHKNNEKFRSFMSKENIHKKEFRQYRGFGY